MVRKQVYFPQTVIDTLDDLGVNFSEQVRQAVQEYIYRLQASKIAASVSKVGDKNG